MGEERSCPESECCSTEEETLHGEVVLKYLYLYVAGTNVQVRVLIHVPFTGKERSLIQVLARCAGWNFKYGYLHGARGTSVQVHMHSYLAQGRKAW